MLRLTLRLLWDHRSTKTKPLFGQSWRRSVGPTPQGANGEPARPLDTRTSPTPATNGQYKDLQANKKDATPKHHHRTAPRPETRRSNFTQSRWQNTTSQPTRSLLSSRNVKVRPQRSQRNGSARFGRTLFRTCDTLPLQLRNPTSAYSHRQKCEGALSAFFSPRASPSIPEEGRRRRSKHACPDETCSEEAPVERTRCPQDSGRYH